MEGRRKKSKERKSVRFVNIKCHSMTPSVIDEQRPIWSSAPFLEMSAFSDGDFSSLTNYLELRRSEFLIGGYVGARALLLSAAP